MAQTVTDLKPQKRRKDRISVFLDGEFAFGLQEMTAARLHVGQTLTEADIAALREADSAEWAKQIAFRFLSFRPRSSAEVRRHLRRKDVDDTVIDQVVDRLAELKLLDDLAFARYWVEQREAFKPRGRRALRHELYQKGLSRQIVEQAVEEVDEMAAAQRAGAKKAPLWRHLAEDEFYLKMRGFLSRRGFDYTTISEVSGELWRDTSDNGGQIEE